MKKDIRGMIIVFMAPALLFYLLAYLYPTLRTLIMSFFFTRSISEPVSSWEFVGLGNFAHLMEAKLFIASLANIAKIWIFGGMITFFFAFLFAVILHAGARGKSFWRAVLYLPNVVSAVAMATMWNLYVYNPKYGMLTTVFSRLGLEKLASTQWTSPDNIFMSMVVAYSFGCVGYFFLIILSGMERIPKDFYEASRIEGAGVFTQFFRITLPLLKPVIVTCLTFWTIYVLGFFIWTQIFSAVNNDVNTITPVVYMYNYAFGPSTGNAATLNAGLAAAIGVVLCAITIVVFILINLLNRGDRYEY